MTVITRFAPAPTGYLHIGSARTALFNWLFARHYDGQFLLRIEDTDRERSTQQAVQAIFKSLEWLGLEWDKEPVFQSKGAKRHVEVAQELLAQGKAYYCYCTPQELETMREEARQQGLPPRYDGRWRERNLGEAPSGIAPVIRFKAPQVGETIINDHVQGEVKLSHQQLDDMILVRADGTPTYMLSVVVDDHEMGITHIIRGDDHLTNAFRQFHLYQACGWSVPDFAHVPLIHGADGAKLSKRHGAVSAETYREKGFLPEAMQNYLLRLGWSHGDEEIISTQQAIQWFNLEAIGRSPARFDLAKLTSLNAHYLREAGNERLESLITPLIEERLGRYLQKEEEKRLFRGMAGLKARAKTVVELADNAFFYIERPPFSEAALKSVTSHNAILLQEVYEELSRIEVFSQEALDKAIRSVAENLNKKLGELAQPLRIALTGSTVSPSVFELMEVLGKEVSLKRLELFIRQGKNSQEATS